MSPISKSLNKHFCELRVFPDDQLRFNVRVSMAGKAFVEGGFKNPDEAHRRGVVIMLAMNGMQRQD